MLNTGKLAGKTLYITGASRGIGKAIALKAAADGAKIVIAAKTADPHPKLPGTIYTAAEESQLKPQSAFLSGKLKLEGDLSKAMSFEKLMKSMRSYHTKAGSTYTIRRNYSGVSTEVPTYTNVPQVFDRIKEVASLDTVQKVNAAYVFDVEGEGKYFVDLKNENGVIGKQEISEESIPDVTISISQENFLKLFNRQLKPATAFMTGQLKLSGDLSKAMALEAIMKASRAEFHTSAFMRGGLVFSSVPEIFERIGKVASAEIVSKVKATYIFVVEGEGKYFIDFKSGDGEVGSGDPPSGKADVTIKMKSDNLLKLFNRELSPASAFMTGKINVSGDLTKALTLEAVMKAIADKRSEEGGA
eukprot:TRINITY_DN2_c0_g1_i1.p1 TRINITY_DN2_c0_g1~~TRINITY_DN2_c0_g1_i1.p1  ORF type:complete len:359 (-),score=80.94 TRINITY_DN2_c0_g1_i1:425-1501(-)